MIPPREQWCIEIDVTNACHLRCSNCTRMLAHARKHYFMSLECFSQALQAVKGFVLDQPKQDGLGRVRSIGVMGGEPQLHPHFLDICAMMEREIPDRGQRHLLTALPLNHKPGHEEAIKRVFGILNHNMHDNPPSRHHPTLIAIKDVVKDADEMWALINACPLQKIWSSSVTEKGFFFCEVAGAMDTIFDGPGGAPVEPGVWNKDLAEFSDQISRWCPKCGWALQLPNAGRLDHEEIEDMSLSNFEELKVLGSPSIKKGKYSIVDSEKIRQNRVNDWDPLDYNQNRRKLPEFVSLPVLQSGPACDSSSS